MTKPLFRTDTHRGQLLNLAISAKADLNDSDEPKTSPEAAEFYAFADEMSSLSLGFFDELGITDITKDAVAGMAVAAGLIQSAPFAPDIKQALGLGILSVATELGVRLTRMDELNLPDEELEALLDTPPDTPGE